MTLGEKISQLRKEHNMTQAELGEVVGVTYQAVSKWERDESLPDFAMISKLAKLFGVTISYFENDSVEVTDDVASTSAEAVAEIPNKMIGVCTVCGKVMHEGDENSDKTPLVCASCVERQHKEAVQAQLAKAKAQQDEVNRQKRALSSRFNKRTIWASIVGGLIFLLVLISGLTSTSKMQDTMPAAEYVPSVIFGSIIIFMWVFQLFFDGTVRSITMAGFFFIRLPGIIFSADLDGLIFLLIMKIVLWIIGAIIFVLALLFMSVVAMFVSIFTFVPTIIKIVRRNENLLE